MSSQTGPVEGERTGSTGSGDEHTGSEKETQTICVVCDEPLGGPDDPERTVHRECRAALRCGISLRAPPE